MGEDVGRSEILRDLHKKLSRTFNAIKNHLFVNPWKVPASSVSERTRLTADWDTVMAIMREMEV